MILNRLFLSEEYKQYLTFSVEISTNTLIHSIRIIYGVMNKNTLIIVLNHFMIVAKATERLLSY